MESLITDRSQSDVVFAMANRDSPIHLKGFYDYRDLNRVGEWINYWALKLNNFGYRNTISIKTDYNSESLDFSKVNDIITKLTEIKNIVNGFSPISKLPVDMDELWEYNGFVKANDIEKFIYEIDEYIETISSTWLLIGTFSVGNNRAYQYLTRWTI